MVTLRDVAEKAGISRTTASMILNNHDKLWNISDRTRQEVLKVAKELDYVPNLRARSMTTRKARTMGVISPLPFNVFDVGLQITYFSTLAGVEAACKESDYHCLFTTFSESDMEKFISPRAMKDGSIDGVILVAYTSKQIIEKLVSKGLPCVHIGTNIDPGTNVESVYGDLDGGIEKTVRKLVAWGHSRIQLIIPNGPGPEMIVRNFLNLKSTIGGFEPEVYMSKRVVSDPQFDQEEAQALVEDILRRPDPPTAFIGLSSRISESLMAGLATAGWSCPRDYSMVVMGLGVEPIWIKSGGVSLSTIDLPMYDVGRRAAEVLLATLGERPRPDESYKVVPCPVVFRDSCGPRQR